MEDEEICNLKNLTRPEPVFLTVEFRLNGDVKNSDRPVSPATELFTPL